MKNIFALLAVLALLTGAAFGQAFAPYAVGTIQSAPGASTPNFTVGTGVESSTKLLLLDVNGTYSTANQVSGAGHSGTLQASGYYKLFGHVLAGGGASLVINTNGFTAAQFVNTARTSANPFVGGGLYFKSFRTIVTYQLPGKDALNGMRYLTVNNELSLTKHVRFVVPLGVNSYLNGTASRVTVAQAGAGLKFVF